ncbi:MAG: LacI family DNA-binding transcriptional regulator [Bacteroidales bacterium]|jgi:LacI family transcriptional regulator|nr:LacI family DNA-binding transcriptional regulator [Bacteroidales bacterium]
MIKKKVTIKDIAKQAGVSVSLVSFVMNNRTDANGKSRYRVSPQTRDHILAVAKELDYRPNEAARALRKGRTKVIGAILSDFSNIFYGEIANHLENIAYQKGYTILFGTSEEEPAKFDMVLRSFIDRNVDGIIITPCSGCDASIQYLISTGIPFVSFDRYNPAFDIPTVVLDNYKAIGDAIGQLMSKSPRRPALVIYDMDISTMNIRRQSYRDHMLKAGFAPEDILIMDIDFNNFEASAEAAADRIIAEGCDGLVTSSNDLAVTVIKALIHKGVKIQQDVNVVGIDYSNIFDAFNPPIPYVLQPLKKMCNAAADMLFDIMEARDRGEKLLASECEPVIFAADVHNPYVQLHP